MKNRGANKPRLNKLSTRRAGSLKYRSRVVGTEHDIRCSIDTGLKGVSQGVADGHSVLTIILVFNDHFTLPTHDQMACFALHARTIRVRAGIWI